MANITEHEVDFLIIGGGINGTDIARAAPGIVEAKSWAYRTGVRNR